MRRVSDAAEPDDPLVAGPLRGGDVVVTVLGAGERINLVGWSRSTIAAAVSSPARSAVELALSR
jgi:hypothetical protein